MQLSRSLPAPYPSRRTNLIAAISYNLYYEVVEAPFTGNATGLAKINSTVISLVLDVGANETGKPTAVLNTPLSTLVIGGFGADECSFFVANLLCADAGLRGLLEIVANLMTDSLIALLQDVRGEIPLCFHEKH